MAGLRAFVRGVSLILLLVLAESDSISHAQVVGGAIAGTIVDQSNATINQASVVIRNEETGSQRQLITGKDGIISHSFSCHWYLFSHRGARRICDRKTHGDQRYGRPVGAVAVCTLRWQS